MNINWHGLGDVLLVGLLAGVALTGLYAGGVRLLASPTGGGAPRRLSSIGAGICFALCAAGVAYGLALLVRK